MKYYQAEIKIKKTIYFKTDEEPEEYIEDMIWDRSIDDIDIIGLSEMSKNDFYETE